MADIATITRIGPESAGMRMSLEEFAAVEGAGGYLYELEGGVIQVVDVPAHGFVVQQVRIGLVLFQASHRQLVRYVAGGAEAALRMPDLQSERHPDFAVYLTPPPEKDSSAWEYWIPEIVIEVVSPSSAERDYHTKRSEYLRIGVKLYWIIDPQDESATVLRRRGDRWEETRLDASGVLTTTLLPGFELKLADVFAAGE